MGATNRKPVDSVDEELEQLLQHPQVTKRLDDFEIRRMKGKLADGATHDEARRIVELPALPESPGAPLLLAATCVWAVATSRRRWLRPSAAG